MNDRLLAGSIDEATFNAKLATLRDELAVIEASLGKVFTVEPNRRAGRAGDLRVLAKSPGNLARFKDGRNPTDSRSRIFEPSARRRNSPPGKEKAV
ncbi:MAG: hypothetical protein Q8K78_02765 [Planctomycetaceae bacterium]|nr:hypothetical protein [Planctomycetaceae bacterium]